MSDPLDSRPRTEAITTLAQIERSGRIAVKDAVETSSDISALIKRAEARHSDLELPMQRFLPFLERCLREAEVPSSALGSLHIEDVYLACGYGLGIEAARTQVEAEHFARIKRRLERMQLPPTLIADVLQELRCRMVEMLHPGYSGRVYSGRGSLGGWLYIAALRIAERLKQRALHELPTHDERVALDVQKRLLPAPDPEMEHLVHSYRAAFEAALQQGLAALSCRERNLLRYHFLERLGIDQLAEIYDVHRATAARWIVRAQQRLADETRARFSAQIPIAADSMPRLLRMIRSKLDLSLSVVLQRTVEQES
jgi:RNA polymerase sigma-70 factor (ECF subfamily)